jgi:hypothetical protein
MSRFQDSWWLSRRQYSARRCPPALRTSTSSATRATFAKLARSALSSQLQYFKIILDLFFLFSLQASSSSTLRFYATNRYLLIQFTTIRSSDRHFAYEKFGVLFKSPRPWPPGKVTGLPVRVRRDFTSAIGIRKAGQVSNLHIFSSWEEKRKDCLFLWEGRCEDCVCASMTLKCNTQRASFLVTSVAARCVQFDSDYSVEDDASPNSSFQVSCLHVLWHKNRCKDTAN